MSQTLTGNTRVVLFDLDGTLVDTAHDLGLALNMQLVRHGKPTIAHEKIWPIASHGSRGLLELGFEITPSDECFEAMRKEYLDLYEEVFTNQPILLPGIEALLIKLYAQNIIWGIVTNKPRRFSLNLINAVSFNGKYLSDYSACLLCGDDAVTPKPSPDTLLMACEALDTKPENCIYVGDAERDVQAAKAAGMPSVVALFGYIAEKDNPAEWGADFMIKQPGELLCLVTAN